MIILYGSTFRETLEPSVHRATAEAAPIQHAVPELAHACGSASQAFHSSTRFSAKVQKVKLCRSNERVSVVLLNCWIWPSVCDTSSTLDSRIDKNVYLEPTIGIGARALSMGCPNTCIAQHRPRPSTACPTEHLGSAAPNLQPHATLNTGVRTQQCLNTWVATCQGLRQACSGQGRG